MLKHMVWNMDEIDSKYYDLSKLPDNPYCPILVKLNLQVPGLTVIPPTFFAHMPALKVLDLSNTNIVSLPSSISKLRLLHELFLRDCSALIELPTQIGMLTNLKLFDIKGTEIMCIPKEMGDLKNLQVLRVSLSQYANYYIKTKLVNENVIPRNMISGLKNLKELCICVSPEAEWWEKEVNDIQNELCYLEKLDTLQWYLPTDKVLHQFLLLKRNHLPIYANISNLMLTIGQHAQLTSCVPRDFEKKFKEFKNCLKWINAEGNLDDISKIMAQAETLFLSRHWTVKKLSTFNTKKLKYCLLAECNKMETLVEVDELSEDVGTSIDGEKVGFGLLEYLSVHYMKELKSICKGPIGEGNLSKLTILALHTCPELTTIFTPGMAQNLSCLIEITVEDCPKVTSLISNELSDVKSGPLFPSLERIFLIDLPELVYIFGGRIILEKLNSLLIYSCRKLCYLSIIELPHIQKIKGEVEWWKDLEYDKAKWESVFEPLKERGDLVEQLSEATNSLKHFQDIVSPEAKDEEALDCCGSGANTSDFPFGGESQPGQVIPADTTMEKGKADMIGQLIQGDDITMAEGIRKGLGDLRIPLETIRLATDNFCNDNVIGQGGFGRVYKGQLFYNEEKVTVAIKRLDKRLGGREFLYDAIRLSGFKHANLVSLLGFCVQGGENMLVYKYMANKSLDMHLSSNALTWTQRLQICIGAARGLKYLHGTQRVIHRDIKSSNILLDDNWNAKISDFGLAKLGRTNKNVIFGLSNLVGTVGYIDPSYMTTGLLGKESDIYSFGVVLFEVLCGRPSYQEYDDNVGLKDQISAGLAKISDFGLAKLLPGLVKMVKTHYEQNKLDAIIHAGLRDQISAESLKKFSAIAYQCLSYDRKKRPPAAKIVAQLESALQCQMDAVDKIQIYRLQLPSLSKLSGLEISTLPKLRGLVYRGDDVGGGSMKDDPTERGDDGSFEDEELETKL